MRVVVAVLLAVVAGAAAVSAVEPRQPLGFSAPPGVVPRHSRTPTCVQLRMQGSDTLRRQSGPVDQVLRFLDTVVEGVKKVADHRVFKRNTASPPKEASMADQYQGFYTPELKPQREPIWKRQKPISLYRRARDVATADLGDTYAPPVEVEPRSLGQALQLSSEIPYEEAVEMQGFPDSFM